MDSARASGSKLRDLLAALTGAAAWFSLGTVAFAGGGADRVAALPPLSYLAAAVVLAVAAARAARISLDEAWPLAISFLVFLPFIPGSIPPALMLFEGPIEVIVWVLVIAGLLARHRLSLPGGFADPRRAPWLAAIVVASLALFAFNQVRAVVPGGDEPHYLVATQSLIADRDLKVENNYAAGSYLDYFGGRLQPHFMQRSAAGEIYSIHAPGVSAIILPGFFALGYAGAVATVIALTALAAALTWMAAWRVSRSASAAWVGVAAVFATSPFLFHTFTIYPDGIGALMVIGAVWLLIRLDDPGVPRAAVLALAGAGLAILPWLHTRFALVAAVFGAAVMARLARRRAPVLSLLAFAAVPLLFATAWFGFFWMIWGTPSPMAPYGADTESSLSYLGRGVSGLLFDQQHGVIGTAPVYVAALLGLWPLFKERRATASAVVIATLAYGVTAATYAMWWGGTSAPARFVAALLPVASVAIAAAWVSFPGLRAAVLLLLTISVALVIPRLLEDSGRFVFNTRSTFDPTIEWLARSVDLALALPSTHRDDPAAAFRDALPWIAAVAAVLTVSFTVARTRAVKSLQWTLVAYSGAAAVIAATTIVWLVGDAKAATPDRSVLAALSGYRPWHTTRWNVSGARSIPAEAFLSRMSIEADADQGAALLRLRRVPAGDFEIANIDAAPGVVAVNVHRNNPLLDAGAAPFRLRLPVPVATLSVRGETAAAPGTPAMRMTPVAPAPASSADGRAAVGAARYGRARVFVFDERAYLEPNGFWTRSEGRATVVIDADDEAHRNGLPIAITGGAAATTIGISVGEWSQSYSLTPGEKQAVVLPPLNGERAWVVSIHSGPGFRPVEREPGSTDVRSLAAWFEIP